jgi:hypothetical protein
MTTVSTSLALQTYEPPVRDRRVHLDDLSGVLELMVLVSLVYAMRSLRRKELSIAQFTHTISMVTLLFIGGHFIEEHVLGVRKLEGLLKFGFQALSEDYTTPPRSGIVNLFRGIWELSGVFVACGGILYSRLWKCDVQNPENCPSCIASSSTISAGQGLAGNGCGPYHLKCRLLRARYYLPIFITWWFMIIGVIGARFNSLLGGSAIRPANDAYYFFSVLKSSPFIGVATLGATLSVWLMAELLDAEQKPQVSETFRRLAMEMEKDDIMRSLLGDQLRQNGTLGQQSQQGGGVTTNRSIHMPSDETPVHASSYVANPSPNDMNGGSFFIDENNMSTPGQAPHSAIPYPLSSNNTVTTPIWSVPSPGYQNPPASFTQQRSPPASTSSIPNHIGSGSAIMSDYERRAAKAEAEAFAWARQQSQQHHTASGDGGGGRGTWSTALDEQLSRSIRTPPQHPIDSSQRNGRVQPPGSSPSPPASSPSNMNLLTGSNSNIGSGPKVKVPPSFSIYHRGDGDVSHLISSDSDGDDDGGGDEDRRAHAAMGLGMYEDLGNNKQNSGMWPTSSSSSSSPQLQPMTAPKGVLLTRSGSNNSLNRSPSGSSLENHNDQPLLLSPTHSGSTLRRSNSFDGNSFPPPETPPNMKNSSSLASSPRNGSSSFSPASKQAAMKAASAVLQPGGILTRSSSSASSSSSSSSSSIEQPTSPLNPVNLASRSSFDLLTTTTRSSSSPTSSPRFINNKNPTSSSMFGGNGATSRGRPEVRSTSSSSNPSLFMDRPSSLTRSNADSSEESEDETEDDDDDDEEEVVTPTPPTNGDSTSMNSRPLSGDDHDDDILKSNNKLTNQKPPSLTPNDHQSSQSSEKSLNSDKSSNHDSDGSSPSSVVALAKHGWKRFVDDSSGAHYWFNENSGESSWTKPITPQQS